MISYIESKKADLIDSKMVVAKGWGIGGRNGEIQIKGYKLPGIR